MHTKSIVHILTKSRMESFSFCPEIDAMEDLSEKYWIKNVIFYKWDTIKFDALICKLEKFHILCKNYSNKEDLKKQVIEFNKKYEILFIDTPLELLINTVNYLKQSLKRPISDNPNIFRNKFLQRKIICKNNPKLGINFVKWIPEKLNINEIEKIIPYPFIIKPIDWVQSSWVSKIKNKQEFQKYIKTYSDFHDRLKFRWVDSKELIIEEFIDWELYSIDYYVYWNWKINISKPVKVKLAIDIKINDYANIARIITKKTENNFKWKNIEWFIKKTVDATWIKNTFIHHEFKVNSKWQLKTIELNGRIGWWRIELLKRTYNLNLYELLLKNDLHLLKLKENNIAINIYAYRRWILKWFNLDILKKIKLKKSVFNIKYEESFIWKEVWLTRDWFIKIWTIFLKNKNNDLIHKDYKYIMSKYKELVFIEEWFNKKSIFWKIKSLFINK